MALSDYKIEPYKTPVYETPVPEKNPQIISGYWSSDKKGKHILKKANLGDTVYFHVHTKDINSREELHLKLYDYDKFIWDFANVDTDKFPNDPVEKTAIVDGRNVATIELLLDESGEPVIDDDHDDLGDLDEVIELYWKISYKKAMGVL